MQTVAFHTLGCKVNQYDTQAMLESFEKSGYQVVPFNQKADVYVLNTCTVTGTGDKKSMQLLRRIQRQSPQSEIIIAGCLAQRKGNNLLSTGARLILGTQNRKNVVKLLEDAIASQSQVVAVASLEKVPFEPLLVTSHDGYTRAIMKIQEGCNRHCSYCIIPSVRGPIRSRPLEEIKKEAHALAQGGFSEVVITGIHITSYGLDLEEEVNLTDVLAIFESISQIKRVRLGSLEPVIVTDAFLQKIKDFSKVCPQFHLALQSGSNTVLKRMGRRYTKEEFLTAVNSLRKIYPQAAFTTDVLTGFPGETQEEFEQTLDTCRKSGFYHMHVFPYSPREGTPAAGFKDQVSKQVKEERVAKLIALGQELSLAYRSKALMGTLQPVLFEEERSDGFYTGYTPQYVPVYVAKNPSISLGSICLVRLTGLMEEGFTAEVV